MYKFINHLIFRTFLTALKFIVNCILFILFLKILFVTSYRKWMKDDVLVTKSSGEDGTILPENFSPKLRWIILFLTSRTLESVCFFS